MTRQRRFKRRVRARMAKTGERYATARRTLLSKARPAVESRYKRLVAGRRTSVHKATGQPMDAWIVMLEKAGARKLSHRDIWRWLESSGHVTDPAVREAITITYEQHIGRRDPGQSCYGDYPASVNKVLRGTVDEVFDEWLQLVRDKRRFNGAEAGSEPSLGRTEKFRYWRVKLTDGTKVSVSVYRMPDGRVSLSIQQRAFPDRTTAEAAKAYWKQYADALPSRNHKSEVESR